MLLLHLYTLDEPDFEDKKLHALPYNAAESAIRLGDKYNLEQLTDAGQRYVRGRIELYFCRWQENDETKKHSTIRRLERLWQMEFSEADALREFALKQIIPVAKQVIEFEPFQTLCAAQSDLAIALIRAQAQAAGEKASSRKEYAKPHYTPNKPANKKSVK